MSASHQDCLVFRKCLYESNIWYSAHDMRYNFYWKRKNNSDLVAIITIHLIFLIETKSKSVLCCSKLISTSRSNPALRLFKLSFGTLCCKQPTSCGLLSYLCVLKAVSTIYKHSPTLFSSTRNQ